MKKTICISSILVWLVICSCQKAKNKSVILVQDCTGTYLRLDSKDFKVCNLEKTEGFTNGTSVIASYRKIKDCNGSAKNVTTCKMYHKNEGWIEVQKISNR